MKSESVTDRQTDQPIDGRMDKRKKRDVELRARN